MPGRMVATANAFTWRWSRDAKGQMEKAFSFSCWAGKEINTAKRLKVFKNTVNFQLSQSTRRI